MVNNESKKTVGTNGYVVETIIDKRSIDGSTQYLLKWKGFSNEHNSWEPVHRLDCHQLIDQFENNSSDKKQTETENQLITKRKLPLSESQTDCNQLQESIEMKSDSSSQSVGDQTSELLTESGEESIAKEILGSTKATGDLIFYIEFNNKRELVPLEVAKRLFPQLVINYFEKHIVWLKDSDESDIDCESIRD